MKNPWKFLAIFFGFASILIIASSVTGGTFPIGDEFVFLALFLSAICYLYTWPHVKREDERAQYIRLLAGKYFITSIGLGLFILLTVVLLWDIDLSLLLLVKSMIAYYIAMIAITQVIAVRKV